MNSCYQSAVHVQGLCHAAVGSDLWANMLAVNTSLQAEISLFDAVIVEPGANVPTFEGN
jgi:hypothetical protein